MRKQDGEYNAVLLL